MTEPLWRLFLAVPLPADAAAEVWAALEPLHARHAAVRWTPPESLHLTLVFLGGVQPARIAEIRAAVEAVAAASQPVDVSLGAGGGRTGRRGGVAWLDVATGREHVARLAQKLDERLPGMRQGQLNRPHLTVARAADEALLESLRRSRPATGVGWTVDRIAVWRSHTGTRGARYEELAVATLRGPAPPRQIADYPR